MKKCYLLMNIGCLECGVSSKPVGVFDTEEEAIALALKLNGDRKFNWRQGGQNSYEVYELPRHGTIDPEYQL